MRKILLGTAAFLIAAPRSPPRRRPSPIPRPSRASAFATSARPRCRAGSRRSPRTAEKDGKTIVYSSAPPRAASGSRRTAERRSARCSTSQPVQSIGASRIDPTNPQIVWVGTGEQLDPQLRCRSATASTNRSTAARPGPGWACPTASGSPRSWSIRRTATSSTSARRAGCGPTAPTAASTRPATAAGPGCTSSRAPTSRPAARRWRWTRPTPKRLLAGTWDFRRKGWTFRSGGEGPEAPSGSRMLESRDGGASWTRAQRGQCQGPARAAVGPGRGRLRAATIRSASMPSSRMSARRCTCRKTAGADLEERDRSQGMVWRPFYFGRIVVDPNNDKRLFKMGYSVIASEDGGKSFANSGGGSHADWHDFVDQPDQHQAHDRRRRWRAVDQRGRRQPNGATA